MHIDHFPNGVDERVKKMTYDLYQAIEPYLAKGEHGPSFGDHQSVFESIYKSLNTAIQLEKER